MNSDGDELVRKRKATARVVCIAAAVLVLVPCLGLRWMRAPKPADAGISLIGVEACGEDWNGEHKCESKSNLAVVKEWNQHASEDHKILGTFAYAGIATIAFSVIAAGALATAGGLAFKDRFVREPIALTTVALLALCLALITGCVFLGSIPQLGIPGGVSWPFFLFGAGIVGGIAGAQMLAKAYSEVRDPYWDGLAPEPGMPPMKMDPTDDGTP